MQRDREIFKSQELVAVLDEVDSEFQFTVYRLHESVKASYSGTKTIEASRFERDPENANQYFSTEEETNVEVSKILRRVLKIREGIHDDDGVERTFIVISNKLTSSLIHAAKTALESGSEDEGEEEEEALGKRVPPPKKAAAKIKSSEDESAEHEDHSEVQAPSEENGSNDGTQAPKKLKKIKIQKGGNKFEKPVKSPKTPKEPKPQRAPRVPKVPKVVEYKKGKFNIKIKEEDMDPTHDDPSSTFKCDCCDICSNRECIRAVSTGNQQLFKSILAQKNKITTLFQGWGCDDPITCLELAIRKGDAGMTDLILNELKPKVEVEQGKPARPAPTIYYKAADAFGIAAIETGFNDKFAYGVATRKVALGRGNREGVNALISDSVGNTNQDAIDVIGEGCEDMRVTHESTGFWETLMGFCSIEIFKKVISTFNWQFENWFAAAVRSCNLPLAAYVAEKMIRSDGYGLNDLHLKALIATTAAELGVVRGVSVKKKSMGTALILPIFCAAINPNLDVFVKMYETLDDRFVRDEKSSSIIFYAALNENPQILEYLLDKNVEFREANKQKMTPLMMAAKLGRHKNVELLLKKGDISKKKSRDGYAAIHYAALENHSKTIQVMIENGADANLPGKDRMTALAIAASRGYYETVKILLEKGAKTIRKDKFKRSPLILALKNCHSKIASLLITHGCPVDEPDSSDNFPIHYACGYGCIESIDFLIKAGANPNVYNSWKLTPIAAAMLKNHYGVINKLLDYPDIDVNCKDDNGRTLLSNSIRNLNEKTVNFAEMIILKHKADISIPDLSQMTPLHHMMQIHSRTFMSIATHNIGILRSSSSLKQEADQKRGWFLKLLGLLSAGTLENLNKKDNTAHTPLMYFAEGLVALVSFSLLAIAPKTSTYDYTKNCYVNKYIDFHSFLDGVLELAQAKHLFIKSTFAQVAEYYRDAKAMEHGMIVDELEEGSTADPAMEAALPSHIVFCRVNESCLSSYLAAFRGYHFANLLRQGLEMQENESTRLSETELDIAQKILIKQKEAFTETVATLVDRLELGVQGRYSSPSAKAVVLTFLGNRWEALFKVPENKTSTINLLNRGPETQANAFGNVGINQFGGNIFGNAPFGGNVGMGFGFGAQQNQMNNNQRGNQQANNKYINLESTGVNASIYEKMKKFRNFQIKEREEVTVELLELISSKHTSTVGETWTEQCRLATNMISMLPSTFFLNSVTHLDLTAYEDADYVRQSCQDMVRSNIFIGKKLLSLAQVGVAEEKAGTVGSEGTIFVSMVSILPSIWNNLSVYTDLSGRGTGEEILVDEFNSRINFVEWVVSQFVLSADQKRQIHTSLKSELEKVDKAEKHFDKLRMIKERRNYQTSLLNTFHQVCTTAYSSFASVFPSTAVTNDMRQDRKKELIAKTISLLGKIGVEILSRFHDDFIPYAKQNLIVSLSDMLSRTYLNMTDTFTVLSNIADLSLRREMKEPLLSTTVAVLELRQQFRDKLFTSVEVLLKKARGKKPVDSEETNLNFKASDKLTTGSVESSGLHAFLHAVLTTGPCTNLAHIKKVINLQKGLGLGDTDWKVLASLQEKELNFCLGFLTTVVDTMAFTDHSLDQFTVSNLFNSISLSCVNLFVLEPSLSLESPKVEKKYVHTRIRSADLLSSLLAQVYSCLDRQKSVPANIKQQLERAYFDKEKNIEVNVKKDLEEYLVENGEFPLFKMFNMLKDNLAHNPLRMLRLENYHFDNHEVEEVERARTHLLLTLMNSILELFQTNRKETKYSLSDKLFDWPKIVSALLCPLDDPGVIGHHEIPEKNNDKNYVKLVEKVDGLRRALILQVSDIFIQRFELKKPNTADIYILEKLFEVYVNFGWTASARETLLVLFDRLFITYGDIYLNIPKVRNPLFYLSEHTDFRSVPWRAVQRVDYPYFEYILSKTVHPNLLHTYEEGMTNKQASISLFSSGFASTNGNFLRALMSHPQFRSEELFEEKFKDRLHRGLSFIQCEQDELFLRAYVRLIKEDELIMECRKNGFTPLLKWVSDIQTVNLSTPLGKYLHSHPEASVRIVKILVDAGATVGGTFHDPEALMKEKEEGIAYPNKYLEGRSSLHLLLLGTPSLLLFQYLLTEAQVPPNVQDIAGNTALHLLTKTHQERTDLILLLLGHRGDPNVLNVEGESCIFEVVRKGNMALLTTLKKHAASFDIVNSRERSPLTLLIEAKNIPGIEYIIELGANVNFRDNFHRNSLHWAINFADHTANSSFEIEDILIRNGVEINTTDLLGRTPLHYPFVKVDDYTVTYCVDPIESVNSLLSKKNLKVDEKDVFGNTPLLYAAQRGSLVSALYLLDKNADLNGVNIEGNNSFAVAMVSKHDHLAITLLNKGADWDTNVTIYTKEKREKIYARVLNKIKASPSVIPLSEIQTFIHSQLSYVDEEEEKKNPGFNQVIRMHGFRWAIRNNWQGLAYMILSRGYDIGEAVYATIQERKFNYTFTLLTKKEDPELYRFVGKEGDNIAHLTCYSASEVKKDLLEKIFRVLVKKGVSLQAKNHLGYTSLHCAAVCGSTEMINLLLENRISPDEKDVDGRTPLMLAAQNKNFDATGLLFEHTKDKKESDREGRNVLHHLCRMENLKDDATLKALMVMTKAVDCNHKDNYGKLPLHYLFKRNLLLETTSYMVGLISDINSRDAKNQSLLSVALKHAPDLTILEQLVKRGVKANGTDVHGRTALSNLVSLSQYSAAKKIKVITQMVETLHLNVDEIASFKVGVDAKTKEPVYLKMSGIDFLFRTAPNPEDLVVALLKLGSKLDLENDAHEKSLETIIKHRGGLELLDILINPEVTKQNIDCKFHVPIATGPYKDKKVTGLCWLINKGIKGPAIQTLVTRGNDINEQDANGISPLSFAVSEQKFEYIKPLLVGQTEAQRTLLLNLTVAKRGLLFEAHPRIVTPLSYCLKYKRFDEVELLLLNGAGMNFTPQGCKPPAYYLVKYCLNTNGFVNFLMRFLNQDRFNQLVASGQAIVPANLKFTITEHWRIDEEKEESMEVSPLYYAVNHGISSRNLEFLLNNYSALNFVGKDGYSAFSTALVKDPPLAKLILKAACLQTDYFILRKNLIAREDPRNEAERKLPLNQPFTIAKTIGKETKVETHYPLNYFYNNGATTKKMLRAIEHGADFNLQEAPLNNNVIMLAILNNDFELVDSIFELHRRGLCVGFDPTKVDSFGRSPIHLVVKSHKNGSYENVPLLKLLAKVYDINKPDNNNFPPIYYAAQQDSGVMLTALTELGAREFQIPFGTRRAPTSLISFATFPDRVPDYEVDADGYLRAEETKLKEKMLTEKESVPLDTQIPHNIKNTSRVVQDQDKDPYDVYMTKVDIKKGQFGGNVFYRMQLLHETNRDVYIVFTRYGRIGDSGQHQLTSFSKKEEALAEFNNIFKQKSGNEWSNHATFTRLKKKYKLVKFSQNTEKEYLSDFYSEYHDKDLPRTTLSDRVKNVIKQVVSAKVLFAKVKELKVDIGKLPLSRLNKPELMQAITLLHEIKKTAKELREERQVDVMEANPEKIFDLLDELGEMTSEYYELIPTTKYRQSSIPPMENEGEINQNIMLVKELLDVEVAVKILLGAKLSLKRIHPMEYCYDSLNIKLVELEEMSVEKSAILEYISKTMDYGLPSSVDVFALERKGETERFAKHLKEKNRKLLWHGSRCMNFLGVLNKGLKIAPPEAPSTGQMFGKGIYFTDSFAKSYNYSDPPLRIVLLCEVALGKVHQLYQATSVTSLTDGYQSVMGVGQSTPDPRKDVVIPNGMVIPLGDQIRRNNETGLVTLNCNEYVVYNEDQVKIRYMVCMNR